MMIMKLLDIQRRCTVKAGYCWSALTARYALVADAVRPSSVLWYKQEAVVMTKCISFKCCKQTPTTSVINF